MNKLLEKEIRNNINIMSHESTGKIVCSISERYNISLNEALDLYNNELKRKIIINNHMDFINDYTKESIPFDTDEHGIPVVSEGEW